MTEAEMRRQRNNKRRKVKRKRQIRRRVLSCTLIIAAVLLVTGIWRNYAGREVTAAEQTFYRENISETGAKTLEAISDNDLDYRLEQFVDEHPEASDICNHANDYPTDMLKALCNNPEMIDFVEGYLDADKTATGQVTAKEMKESIPLLLQWDERWGYADYGESNIGLAGCGPTCISMVTIGLTKDKSVTPNIVAQYAMDEGYFLYGSGTSWGLMTEGCRHFGITGTQIGLDEGTIQTEVEAGHPIICSMSAGDFTTQGHFIVIVGIKDGKYIVNDPNSRSRSNILWSYDKLSNQIKNLWTYTKQ